MKKKLGQKPRPVVDRFWEKVNKNGSVILNSQCWEWTAGTVGNGYGRFNGGGKKLYIASRFSYELHYGKFPSALWVCHKCDNPPCVNPDHLFLGTQPDNEHDKIAKGRHYNQIKTHCPRGHEYTAENTRWNRTARRCITCSKMLKNARYLLNHPRKQITHCPQGHEYTAGNTRIYRHCRHCRECSRIKSFERYHANRNKKPIVEQLTSPCIG